MNCSHWDTLWIMSSRTFSERVKRLRAAQGLTQAQLADLAGLHRVYVAKLECGQKDNPRLGTLKR